MFANQKGNTLTVRFANSQDEVIAEEIGDEVILMKDDDGKVIGYEKLNYILLPSTRLNMAFETVAV